MEFKIPEGGYDYILFDSNNFFNRYYAVQVSKTKDESFEQNKQCIANSIRGYNKILSEYGKEGTHSYFLFDNAKSKLNVRKLIDPSYKFGRNKKPKSFYRALDYFRIILLNYSDNITCVYGTGQEADDIAPVILKELKGKILLVSEDMDWCRLLKENVRILNRNGVMGLKEFEDRFKFKPTENSVVLYKTIHGDSVDNIPVGIPNLPKALTLKLIDDYEDIYDVEENLDIINYLSEDWKYKIRVNLPRLHLNFQLVSFVNLNNADVSNCTFNAKYKPKILKTFYETLDFNVKTVDKRLYEYYYYEDVRKKITGDNLFQVPKPKRW